jgi:hypothetical protein
MSKPFPGAFDRRVLPLKPEMEVDPEELVKIHLELAILRDGCEALVRRLEGVAAERDELRSVIKILLALPAYS